MTGRTRMTRAESKARTRTELVEAARRVFLERGYHGASLDAVADAAGFSTGAVYSAFEGKADLFLAVFDRRVEDRTRQMEKAGSAATSLADLAELLAREFALASRQEHAWSLLVIEFWVHAGRDPALRRRFAQRHDALKAALARVMAETAARTGQRLTIAVDDVATAATALANGLTLEGLTHPDTASDKLLPTFATIIMNGLTDRPGRGGRA